MFMLIILIYIIIAILEIYPLVEQKKKKEIIAYSITLFIAFGMSLLLSLDVDIPSPVHALEKLVEVIKASG